MKHPRLVRVLPAALLPASLLLAPALAAQPRTPAVSPARTALRPAGLPTLPPGAAGRARTASELVARLQALPNGPAALAQMPQSNTPGASPAATILFPAAYTAQSQGLRLQALLVGAVADATGVILADQTRRTAGDSLGFQMSNPYVALGIQAPAPGWYVLSADLVIPGTVDPATRFIIVAAGNTGPEPVLGACDAAALSHPDANHVSTCVGLVQLTSAGAYSFRYVMHGGAAYVMGVSVVKLGP